MWGPCELPLGWEWSCTEGDEDEAASAPGSKETPNRATQDGWVSGRWREMACFRQEASSMRPAGKGREGKVVL